MADKAYQSLPFNNFGAGLNLRDKTDSVDPAECIDAMNVVFTDRGAVEQRFGYGTSPKALENRVDSLSPFYTASGTKQLLAGCGSRLEALNTSLEVLKSATGLAGGPWDFARFGKPNSEVVYAGNGTDTLRKWDGTEWSAPTATIGGATGTGEGGEEGKAMPKARCLAAWENRLFAAGFEGTEGGPGGAESSPAHIYASDPGNPEVWHVVAPEANYDQIAPGDGEKTQTLIPWGGFLFAFKESQLFVFYGVDTNEEGASIFRFRPVTTGVGLVSPRAVCAHHTGVYFLSRQGVYRTTGQEPELVSSPITPIFEGGSSDYFTGGGLATESITNCAMEAWGNRIYLSYPTENACDRTLIYDTRFDWWALSDLPASSFCVFRPGFSSQLMFGLASGEHHVAAHSPLYTTDGASAISSHFRSGWPDFSSSDIKKIRATKVWGSGMVQVGISHDFELGTGKLTTLNLEDPTATEWGKSTWGGGAWAQPKPVIGKERRVATKGTVFSVYFSSSVSSEGLFPSEETFPAETTFAGSEESSSWSVHRLEHLTLGLEEPSKITA